MRSHSVLVPAGILGALLLGPVVCAAGEADVAAVLPPRTVAYLRLSNFSRLLDGLRDEDKKEPLLGFTTGLGLLDELTVKASEKMLAQIRAVHLSLHRLTVHRDYVDLDMVFIADVGQPTGLNDLLPPLLMRLLRAGPAYRGTQTYLLDTSRGRREGIPFYFASLKGKVIVASDRARLEGMLDALAKGRKRSLAGHGAFQRLRREHKESDAELYVSMPDLLRTIESTMDSRHDRREFRAGVKLFGLDGVEAASYTARYSTPAGTIRLLMDPDSLAWKLLAQPAKARTAPAYIPGSAVLCLTANVGNARETLERAYRHTCGVLLSTGAVRRRQEFHEELADAQKEVGISFETAASLLAEVGFFLDKGFDDKNLCLFGKVTDVKKAGEVMRQLVNNAGFRREARSEGTKSYQHLGVTVNVSGRDFIWAFVGNYLFIAPRKETVENVITAARLSKIGVAGQGKSLAASEGYRKLNARWPAQSSAFFYLDTDRFVRQELRRDFRNMPPALQAILKGLSHGVCLRARDEVVELHWAQSKGVNPVRVFKGGVLSAVQKSRDEAMKVRSASRLKGIAQATNLWLNKFGWTAKWPPSLKSLYDKKVIPDLKAFLHPSNESKVVLGKFASDYECILDRAGYQLTESMTPMGSLPLAWEKRSFYTDGGRNVVFFDSHVEYCPPKRFQTYMKTVAKFIKENQPKK